MTRKKRFQGNSYLQFATLLEEFRFLLERIISGADLLDKALKDGGIALILK